MDEKETAVAKKMLKDRIYAAHDSNLTEFKKFSNTYINWQTRIFNTFNYNYTYGFTKGCNNKIKVLKRNAYGYRNFNKFKNRIIFMFNNRTRKISAAYLSNLNCRNFFLPQLLTKSHF